MGEQRWQTTYCPDCNQIGRPTERCRARDGTELHRLEHIILVPEETWQRSEDGLREENGRLMNRLTAAQQERDQFRTKLDVWARTARERVQEAEARAETAEADADRERELGKSHFTRAISAEAALEDVEAERDKLRAAASEFIDVANAPSLNAGRMAFLVFKRRRENLEAALASTTTPAPVDEEER